MSFKDIFKKSFLEGFATAELTGRVILAALGIAAVLALCYYYLLPFDLVVRQTLVILAFSPIGSATPVFTRQLGCDAGLSSAINSIAIVISITIIVVLLMVM